MVARRFPKAEVASSTLVGGIHPNWTLLLPLGHLGEEVPGHTERSEVREGSLQASAYTSGQGLRICD